MKFWYLRIAGILLLSFVCQVSAKDNKSNYLRLYNQDHKNRTLVNIGDISMWLYADGTSGNDPSGNSGVIFPRGTAGVIFQDGIIWGGLVHDGSEPVLRVGGQYYTTGTVAGSIISPGVAEDFNSPEVDRIWRIRRDFLTADLRRDAAEMLQKPPEEVTAEEIAGVRAQYKTDWLEWPWQKGAPFYDADADGAYTPQFNPDGSPKLFPEADEPGLANADQVVWLVVNDLDAERVQSMSGSPAIGLEMQATFWAYKDRDILRPIIFKHYRLIYKGTAVTPSGAVVDSMFFGQWSDPDIGTFTDDLVGCDTLLDVGVAYNAFDHDNWFDGFSLPPPAAGYDVLAGPLVEDMSGKALFGLRERIGFRNLKMTSFIPFLPTQNHPPSAGDYSFTLQFWNRLRGYRGLPESPVTPWLDPDGRPSKYVFSGDPAAGSGWLDANPGDRRFVMASGPFSLALGDTNEFTVALIAGLGFDRLTSISALKFHARAAQDFLDSEFAPLKTPPSPTVTATELDGEIILNWSVSQADVERVERPVTKGYLFEGYTVYQLPSADAALAEGVRIATFDRINGVRQIVNEHFNPAAGMVFPVLVQKGADSGIFRSMVVRRDSLNARRLINGTEYFFAVTAYHYNPAGPLGIWALASAPAAVVVTPQWLKPGLSLNANIGDTLAVAHVQGASEGEVIVTVADPAQVTGDDYRVVFSKIADTTTVWHLLNVTRGDTVLRNQANASGDEDYLIADGLLVKVVSPERDFQRVANGGPTFIEVANENGPLSESDYDGNGTPFEGNMVWHSLNAGGYGDRYFLSTTTLDESGLDTNFDALAPFDFELRFTTLAEGSWGWWKFTLGSTGKVPFQLWNVGAGTLDDPSDDIRMISVLQEGRGTVGVYSPDYGPEGAFGFWAFDAIYWFMPAEGETYEDYAEDASDGWIAIDHTGVRVMSRLLVVDSDGGGTPPLPGSIVRIFSTKPNTPDDVFSFSTAGYKPVFSAEAALRDVEEVNVFPNPYYGPFAFFTERDHLTFTHLPEAATIRIFTLAGSMVRKLEKSDPGQFLQWDLKNAQDKYVGNGIYIAHVEMPVLGANKVLRLVVLPN